MSEIQIRFAGPPGPGGLCIFVDIEERATHKSVGNVGYWEEKPSGDWLFIMPDPRRIRELEGRCGKLAERLDIELSAVHDWLRVVKDRDGRIRELEEKLKNARVMFRIIGASCSELCGACASNKVLAEECALDAVTEGEDG